MSNAIQIRMGGYGPSTTGFSRALKFIGDRLEAQFGDRIDVKYVWNIMDFGYRAEDILWLVERGILTLSRPVETFTFTDIEEAPVPSLNRGFSAPIKLIVNLTGDHLRFLAAHDPDPFNRWQAVQMLAMRLLVDNAEAIRALGQHFGVALERSRCYPYRRD